MAFARVYHVVGNESVHENRSDGLLREHHLFEGYHPGEAIDGVGGHLSFDDVGLLLDGRIAQTQTQDEAIQLRFGQGEGPAVLRRVSCGEEQEGPWDVLGDAVDGDLLLLHCFQEGGLGPGGGAVYFVHQHHVRHDGAGPEVEFPVSLVEDVGAGDVGGEKVRGALDALEGAAEGEGDAFGEDGLADAGHTVDEHVSLAKQGHYPKAEGLFISDDDLSQVFQKRIGDFSSVAESKFLHRGLFLLSGFLKAVDSTLTQVLRAGNQGA